MDWTMVSFKLTAALDSSRFFDAVFELSGEAPVDR
jgi:hypothetical protein